MLIADVSEPSISSIFIGRWMKMELIEGSETSAISIMTPGNYPKENILHTEHGESLKSRTFLCLWFTASLIYINNCPTRRNTKQSIYYSASSRYMFRVSTTPVISSTQNCNYSLRYWSYFLCSYLPPTWSSYLGHVGGR